MLSFLLALLLIACGLSLERRDGTCDKMPTDLTSFLSAAGAQEHAARFAEEQFVFRDLAAVRAPHLREMGLPVAAQRRLLRELERIRHCLPRWELRSGQPPPVGRCDADAAVAWVRAAGGRVDERLYPLAPRARGGSDGGSPTVALAGVAGASIPARAQLASFVPSLVLRATREGANADAAAVGADITRLLRAHSDSGTGLARKAAPGGAVTWLDEVHLAVALLAERQLWASPPLTSAFGPLLACLPNVLSPERCDMPLCAAAGVADDAGAAPTEEAGECFDSALLGGIGADVRVLAQVRDLVRWGAVRGGGIFGAPPSAVDWRWALATVVSQAVLSGSSAASPASLVLLPTLELLSGNGYDHGRDAVGGGISLRVGRAGGYAQFTEAEIPAGARLPGRQLPAGGVPLAVTELFFFFGQRALGAAATAASSTNATAAAASAKLYYPLETELRFKSHLLKKVARQLLGAVAQAGDAGIVVRAHPRNPLALSVTSRVEASGTLNLGTLAVFRMLALPQSQLKKYLPAKVAPVNKKQKKAASVGGRAGGIGKQLSADNEKLALALLGSAVDSVAKQHAAAKARLAAKCTGGRAARQAAVRQFHASCMDLLHRSRDETSRAVQLVS
jgi:hypothetical protein